MSRFFFKTRGRNFWARKKNNPNDESIFNISHSQSKYVLLLHTHFSWELSAFGSECHGWSSVAFIWMSCLRGEKFLNYVQTWSCSYIIHTITKLFSCRDIYFCPNVCLHSYILLENDILFFLWKPGWRPVFK